MILPAAIAVICAAMLLVRLGWARRRDVALGGWCLAAVGLAVLAVTDGAWGLSVGITVGILIALLLLLHAAAHSSAKPARPVAGRLPPATRWSPSDSLRRVAVFVLTVPLAFAAAQWLAFGAQAIGRRAGWSNADAAVLGLYLQPVAWTTLMVWQLTRVGLVRMLVPPFAAALIGTALWIAA